MNPRERFRFRTIYAIFPCLLCGIAILISAAQGDAGAAEEIADAAAVASGGTGDSGVPFWLWLLLGRMHQLLVHFPIGRLCVALLMELIEWRGKSDRLRGAIEILLWIGFISGALAVLFGWLLAGEGYEGTTIEVHRWAGIITAVLSGATLFSLRKRRTGIYRSLLLLTV